MKYLRWYPVFILNVVLFVILFTHILIKGLSVFSPCFLRYIQNNVEYQIHNMINKVIQILRSMSELKF